ncbi:MAG: hypothetical protein QOH12_1918 [Solirubrobacteraceae bacterium]|jgi:hypothetical protein|nr:hypothetical protein [Solirubrobacteraceae bacterium]
MLGRKTYTQEELDHATAAVDLQLAAHRRLTGAVADAKGRDADSALEDFDSLFFNNMTLVLDRHFVHRLRAVTGKDGNPLNEVELICESLLNHDGIFRGNKVIKYVPEESVVGLRPGDPIRLTADEFDRLSAAFFADLERKFVA